jgi:general secretion pathway protein K
MALIAVLWIVAALGVIVAGLTQAVRSEIRLVSGARDVVVAEALGEAAIHLVLQDMASNSEKVKRMVSTNVVFQGQSIAVQVMPLNGLIDINQAPASLLASLFTVAGRLPPGDAANLAQAVIETRERKDSVGQPEGFEATEDLLRVPGLGYDLYANISGLVTADQPGSGKVNPMAAPIGVLQVLAGGDAQRAGSIAENRASGQTGVDTTTTLTSAYVDDAGTDRFELKARVLLPGGASISVARSVDMADGDADGLPWRTYRTENKFVPVNGKAN